MDQSRRTFGEIVVGRLEAARHDNEVFSLDEAIEPQLVEKRIHHSVPRRGEQEAKPVRAAVVLRARRERPRRRAAK